MACYIQLSNAMNSNGPRDRVVYPGSIVAIEASFSDDAFDILPEEFGAPTSDLCSKGQEDHRDVDVRPDAFLNPIPDNIHGSRILGGSVHPSISNPIPLFLQWTMLIQKKELTRRR